MSEDLAGSLRRAYRGWSVADRVERLRSRLDRRRRAGACDHAETVNEYYDLCTPFMRYGWGESLHFAPLAPQETLEESIVRHQRLMIGRLELRAGMRVVDIGCGLGGPMRRVARESGARVFCINNNARQLEETRRRNAAAGLDGLAEYMKCDFMDMSAIDADSFDAGYAIESTCHAPDKQRAFAGIHRVLKPGALLWGQEMCLTEAFDPDDGRHRAIRDALMRGVALKEIAGFADVNRALEAAGFEIVEAADRNDADGRGTPWHRPLEGRGGTLRNAFRRTPLGRQAMISGLRLAETLRVFPPGSAAVVRLMDRTAEAYVAGGKAGIFTPLYCFLARKPG